MEIISPWMLYFWTRLDSISHLLTCFGFVTGCSGLFLLILTTSENFGEWCWVKSFPDELPDDFNKEEQKKFYSAKEIKNKLKKINKASHKLLFVATLFIVIATTLPTKKDMAIIYVIPKIANNESIQNESVELYNIAKNALKEYAGLNKE